METFRNVVNSCGFHDIPFTGYEFTYDNGSEAPENVQCGLDRALVTTDWLTIFSNAHVWNLNREWSGHAPIKLTINKNDHGAQLGEKPFQFKQI